MVQVAAVDTTNYTPRTYGNWRQPRSAGIGAFGSLGTAVIFAGLIAVILAMMLGGLVPAVVVGTLVLLALSVMLFRDKHGASLAQRVGVRLGWAQARAAGAHLYRSGPLGRTPWGVHQLPGLAAQSRLSEYRDSYGRPFALLHVPATGHYTVVIASDPDGAALVDEEQVDGWVAHWGAWLASLGHEPGLVAASVTIETAPDTGFRLRREVGLHADPNAPAVAKAMLAEATSTWPIGSATVRAWIALTFAAAHRPGGRRRGEEEVGRELAARLPGLTQGLGATGAGACRPVTARALCEAVRVAYDPAAERLLDAARAEAQEADLAWSDVGPVAAQAGWDYYRHDGAVSTSWSMTVAPRGEVYSSVLARLVAPHPDIARKRVSLLYRPLPAGRAARIVELDKRNADVRATSSTRPSARVLVEQRAAAATAAEEARGAGLVNFGMVVTATVDDGPDLPERLADARAAVDNLSATARLVLRPVYGSQDSAFAASLPLGLVLPRHLKVPSEIREAL
jgi:hypothetical protein